MSDLYHLPIAVRILASVKLLLMKPASTILLSVLLLTGCIEEGPRIYIESDKPLEDFVIECAWSSIIPPLIHGNRGVGTVKYHVISSGEEFECGSAMGKFSYVMINHPTYVLAGNCNEKGCPDEYTETGARLYRVKPKLALLDEYEQQFKSGEWKKYKWPGPEFMYADKVRMVCGFPHHYIENYFKSGKKVSRNYFKTKYGDDMLACFSISIPVMKKYQSNAYDNSYPDANEIMDVMWNSNKWRDFSEN